MRTCRRRQVACVRGCFQWGVCVAVVDQTRTRTPAPPCRHVRAHTRTGARTHAHTRTRTRTRGARLPTRLTVHRDAAGKQVNSGSLSGTVRTDGWTGRSGARARMAGRLRSLPRNRRRRDASPSPVSLTFGHALSYPVRHALSDSLTTVSRVTLALSRSLALRLTLALSASRSTQHAHPPRVARSLSFFCVFCLTFGVDCRLCAHGYRHALLLPAPAPYAQFADKILVHRR